MKNHTKYPALATTILLSATLLAAPAQADTTQTQRESSPVEALAVESVVAAPITASIKFDRTTVTTKAAPVAVAPPVKAQASTPRHRAETPTAPVASTPQPTKAPAKASAPKHAATTPAAPAPVASASGNGAAIAAAAYAQLGVTQDCTALATNSLRAVGINFHGWPAGYLGLGRTVSAAEALPGDLAYYANGGAGLAHIAVYVGGGKAVHGGWNGNQTSLQSVNVGSGPVYIRVA